eukprot:6189250-Pleurochrysis_carterae.AAC.1
MGWRRAEWERGGGSERAGGTAPCPKRRRKRECLVQTRELGQGASARAVRTRSQPILQMACMRRRMVAMRVPLSLRARWPLAAAVVVSVCVCRDIHTQTHTQASSAPLS